MEITGTHFFGYGSLVNLATHGYKSPRKATVQGWRREWFYSAKRDVSFLSVVKDPDASIQGLIADVTDIGWDALDIRETSYTRFELAKTDGLQGVQIYVADPLHIGPKSQDKPILLSYLDCVVQGFLEQFGEQGVTAFFESTSGWDRPIKDDRNNPIYPRAQVLTNNELQLVDGHLEQLSAKIVP